MIAQESYDTARHKTTRDKRVNRHEDSPLNIHHADGGKISGEDFVRILIRHALGPSREIFTNEDDMGNEGRSKKKKA